MNYINMTELTNFTATNWFQRDDEVALLLAPVVVYVSTLMCSGIIGNVLVCYICYVKWREKKIKYFIGCLATLDLLTCCICIPMEIAMLCHPILLNIDALCKLQRFSRAVTSLGSGFMLAIIAVDRYISICQHARARIHALHARWLCIASILVAIFFSWPSLILFGNMDQDKHTIAETSCSTSQYYDDTSYPVVYYGIMFVLFFSVSLSLIIFYSLIWLRILRLPNMTPKRQSFSESDFTNSNLPSVFSSDILKKSAESGGTAVFLNKNCTEKKKGSTDSDKLYTEQSIDSFDFSNESSRTSSVERNNKKRYYNEVLNNDNAALNTLNRRSTLENRNKKCNRNSSFLGRLSLSRHGSSRNTIRRRRLTITMFAITMVQILSFLPYISLLICKSFVPQFLSSLDVEAQVAYNIGILSHFISSAVNPWVYGFGSKIFRREFRKAFCKKLRKIDSYQISGT